MTFFGAFLASPLCLVCLDCASVAAVVEHRLIPARVR